MVRRTMWRGMRMMVLAAAVSLSLGSLAWGQAWGQRDDDYYNRHDEAREQGYRNGSRDGQRAGQYDSERGRRFKFKTDDWEDSRGFEHWMGNKGHYKQAYRDGYERAYRQAYGYDRDHRGWDRDRDDNRWHDHDDWR
jgi:hypothetical protein